MTEYMTILYDHLIWILLLLPYIPGILITLFQKLNPIHWPHLLNNLLTSVHMVLWDSILCIYSYDSKSLFKLFCFLWIWWFLIPYFIGLQFGIRIQKFFFYFKFPGWLHTEYLCLFTVDELPEHCIERELASIYVWLGRGWKLSLLAKWEGLFPLYMCTYIKGLVP